LPHLQLLKSKNFVTMFLKYKQKFAETSLNLSKIIACAVCDSTIGGNVSSITHKTGFVFEIDLVFARLLCSS
jgi:hypothetical protein